VKARLNQHHAIILPQYTNHALAINTRCSPLSPQLSLLLFVGTYTLYAQPATLLQPAPQCTTSPNRLHLFLPRPSTLLYLTHLLPTLLRQDALHRRRRRSRSRHRRRRAHPRGPRAQGRLSPAPRRPQLHLRCHARPLVLAQAALRSRPDLGPRARQSRARRHREVSRHS
jgi:hypothetical protein